MSDYRKMGHAMRRRVGAPSNHFESAGPATSGACCPTAEESMSANMGSGKVPTGFSASAPQKGTLMPKKNTQAGDPSVMGAKAARTPVLNAGGERLGARYSINVNNAVADLSAAPTLANARTVPSVQGRQAPNFGDGVNSSMA